MKDELSRKDLFRQGLGQIRRWLANALEERLDVVPRTQIRPPGAQVEALFVSSCTGCGDCALACPYQAIRMIGKPGLSAEHTPVIQPTLAACRMCPEVPCAARCPTGSLGVPAPQDMKIGTAVIQEATCIAYGGEPCARCVEGCPEGEKAIVRGPRGGPVVSEAGCTGCGECTRLCPTSPRSIRIRPR